MGVAAEQMQHRDQIVDVIVEIEAALPDRDYFRVDPFGDVDVVIGQKAFDRAAQQRRIMARHRRDDEQARLRTARQMLEGALEMQQPAERPLPDGGDMYGDLLAANRRRLYIPFRLAIAAGRALEKFHASGHGLAE